MFITLLLVTFAVSIGVATAVVRLFRSALAVILARLVTEELAFAWQRYMEFAIYVVGVSGGVRVWELEKYITGRGRDGKAVELNTDRWVLEVYRTIIETLQSIAWMLLVFFVFALIAFVIMRGFELRQAGRRDAGHRDVAV